MKPTADGGPTDGLRRKGSLVWNMALVLMVSLVENPLTGEPDAGNPPVRFGGRGGTNMPSLPLSRHAPEVPSAIDRTHAASTQESKAGREFQSSFRNGR